MTGWRVGYIAAPKWIADGANKMQGQLTSANSSISQRAALAAITGDLAPTLCAMGEVDEAIAIEALVHSLNQEHGGFTLCAYALPQRADGFDMRLLYRLSAEHNAIHFPSQLWTERLALPVRAGHGANA